MDLDQISDKMIFDPFWSVDPDGLREYKLLRNRLNFFSSLLLANPNALFVSSYGFHSVNQKCFNMYVIMSCSEWA